jgi:hypothetical protein
LLEFLDPAGVAMTLTGATILHAAFFNFFFSLYPLMIDQGVAKLFVAVVTDRVTHNFLVHITPGDEGSDRLIAEVTRP